MLNCIYQMSDKNSVVSLLSCCLMFIIHLRKLISKNHNRNMIKFFHTLYLYLHIIHNVYIYIYIYIYIYT